MANKPVNNTSENPDTKDEKRTNPGGMNMDRKPNMQHSDEIKGNSDSIESQINSDDPTVHQTQSFSPSKPETPNTNQLLDKEIDSEESENRPSEVGIKSNEELNGRR